MKPELQLTEEQVRHALRLFVGRQCCDRFDMEKEQAMLFVLDHEADIIEALENAIGHYLMAHPVQDTDENG